MVSSSSDDISTVKGSLGAVDGAGASAVGGTGPGGASVEPSAAGKDGKGGQVTVLRGRGGTGRFFIGEDGA